jgi:hypothetical protein
MNFVRSINLTVMALSLITAEEITNTYLHGDMDLSDDSTNKPMSINKYTLSIE